MSERGDSNDDQAQKSENLNFSFQDILDESVNNPNNPNFQHIVATFQNHDNQSASYNNLPAELQHLFSMSESNASSDVPMWNGTPVKDSPAQEQSSTPNGEQQTANSPFNSQASPTPLNKANTSPSVPSPQTRIQSSPSPMASTPQTQNAPSPSTASPHQQQLSQAPFTQSPQIAAHSTPPVNQSPKVIAPQAKTTPQPQTSTASTAATAPSTTENAPSSMTLLDNITAQLSPDRKDRFIELFRQLQTTAVTAPEFLAQAKQLLDQQQYQQLENLKSKPSAPPPRPNLPIQPQQAMNAIKRPMSSSQVRAEDTQRAMSGLIAPQAKRSRTSDIPINTSQPLYRPTGTPVQQQQQQHLIQQKQQQLQLQQQQLMMRQQQQMKQHLLQQHQQQQQQLLQQQQQQQQQQQSQQQPTLQPPVEAEDNAFITQNFMNTEMLTAIIAKRAHSNGLLVGTDVVTLIALATQERMMKFIHQMIAASKHRVDSQTFTQPTQDDKGNQPFKIADVQDIKKQLLAIERVEREEERKRKEIISERERKAQLGEEANEGGEEDGKPTKKKKKKDMGPGVTARYMSDDVRNKTTNETALMIAGGVMKSWMLTGVTGGGTKEKPQPRQSMDVASPSSATTPVMDISPPLATSPTNTSFGEVQDEQPRGRGRPRRRKSASGPDIMTGKKVKGFPGGNRTQDGGLTLPPSKIGRPHRLGEQSARKLTARDALFVLEDENENKRDAAARRTLLKAYATLR